MHFKDFFFREVVELNKPSSKVKRQTVIKDKGTNVAHPVIQFQWITKIGNHVNLQFVPKGNDSYDLMFYVNNVLYDFASKKEGYVRDIEILSNVFYLVKKKADQLKAKQLSFHAHVGEKDQQTIYKLNPEPFKPTIFNLIKNLKQEILSSDPEWATPTPNIVSLYQKLKREVPKLVQHNTIKLLNQIESKVQNNEEIDDLINSLELKYNQHPLVEQLKKFNDAIKSNRPEGLTVRRNRRANIYKRILQRNFSDQWNIKDSNGWFVLERI